MAAPIRPEGERFPHNFQRMIPPQRPKMNTDPNRYMPPNMNFNRQFRGLRPTFSQPPNLIHAQNEEEFKAENSHGQNQMNINIQNRHSNETNSHNNFNPVTYDANNKFQCERFPLTAPPDPFRIPPGTERLGFQNVSHLSPTRYPAESTYENKPPKLSVNDNKLQHQNIPNPNVGQIVSSAMHNFQFIKNTDQQMASAPPGFMPPPQHQMMVPPPPCNMPELPPPIDVDEHAINDARRQESLAGHRRQDQAWLDSWLIEKKSRSKEKYDNEKGSMSISEAHKKTQHMILLMARLAKNKGLLQSMECEDRLIWDPKVQEVNQMKNELEELYTEMTTPAVVAELKQKTQMRRKKRERIKRRRQAEYEAQQQVLVTRDRLHKDIDEQQDKIATKQKAEKQEADMKKEGDATLALVKRKQSENTKMTQVFSTLGKLRQLRKDRQERQGLHWSTSVHDHTFETRCRQWTRLLNQQDDIYKAEESTIKVIIETEHEETREKEREIARHRDIARRRREEKHIDEILFGNMKDTLPDDPLYPFTEYFDAANQSHVALISIRHEWDRYLARETTAGATCIPHTWVIPPEPSSEIWAACLQET